MNHFAHFLSCWVVDKQVCFDIIKFSFVDHINEPDFVILFICLVVDVVNNQFYSISDLLTIILNHFVFFWVFHVINKQFCLYSSNFHLLITLTNQFFVISFILWVVDRIIMVIKSICADLNISWAGSDTTDKFLWVLRPWDSFYFATKSKWV